jgi:uncharacterized protein (TIGR02757 family)
MENVNNPKDDFPCEAARRLDGFLPLFEDAYRRFSRREFVSPDPLEKLYLYDAVEEREIVGLAVSSIAYGRVAQINRNADRLLSVMGPSPRSFLLETPSESFPRLMEGFRHRFTSGEEMGAFLAGIGRILREFGSLEAYFGDCLLRGDGLIEAISRFSDGIRTSGGLGKSFLFPSPRDGSACKRFFLFLKWMVRSDDVDPGGWKVLVPGNLVLPMDVHMFRMCSFLGLTKRKSPDLKTALEVTGLFKRFLPEDPVKYDFVLTRFGIRREMDAEAFVRTCLEGDELWRKNEQTG